MHIQLNGEARQLQPDATITTLLQAEGLANRQVAVEVNGAIVPRGQHAMQLLHDGDRIEIVHALGGG
ncbi:MAG: sulfur carrier protein ThiS [Thermomonas sp.]